MKNKIKIIILALVLFGLTVFVAACLTSSPPNNSNNSGRNTNVPQETPPFGNECCTCFDGSCQPQCCFKPNTNVNNANRNANSNVNANANANATPR